ncbi:Crp/Fnr family transcriptional regulator [Breoghania sp.]|uniref:Crp/Fnr family transcriptional regulator n=1 Tax=Breoghania sp. TaxID=2065378 RepID=UPI0026141816|nr:Crp/Fnr family transcriptional regulator [Breoghania sp.]MDJ0933696.1 Crp/Fnr family transcriptional regulator [Breoghania sp.]
MKRVDVGEAWTGVADCRQCMIRDAVLFAGLKEEDFSHFHRPIDQLVYHSGGRIYDSGDKAETLFTIRSGLVKLTQYLLDGTARIVRLLRKIDLFGLEVMIDDEYSHTATALRDTEVCRLPVDVVRRLSHANPLLFNELMSRWHQAMGTADRWITEFSTGSARDRVARLLLWLSEKEEDERCELFSCEDLGALLGLTTETASRTIAELKRKGFISEPRPNQFLCDTPNLRRLVGM